MITDNHKELQEPHASGDLSPSSPSLPTAPLGHDNNRPRIQPNFAPRQPLSLQPSSALSTLSDFSSSQASLVEDVHSPLRQAQPQISESGSDIDEDNEQMSGSRPSMHRPTDRRSQQPLLNGDALDRPSYDAPNGSARPALAARSSTFRNRDLDAEGKSATRKKYTYAAFFLLLSLVSFTIQTETAVYIQQTLGWQKAYCML
jgi:hypothetical protein